MTLARGSAPLKGLEKSVTAFAPASVANVAVGFDLMGFAAPFTGDTVTVSWLPRPTVTLSPLKVLSVGPKSKTGNETALPSDPLLNTATAGLIQLVQDRSLTHGFHVEVKKGIPMGSGLGGSAASSAAAVFAASHLLEQLGLSPLTRLEMLHYALIGEKVASLSAHADNIAPSLFGGLLIAKLIDSESSFDAQIIDLPIPQNLWCTVVHPNSVIETKTARGILKQEISLQNHIEASANLASVLAGLYTGDFGLLRKGLKDVVIEPQRAHLIPEFQKLKDAVIKTERALGCSISGSGPSVFSWSEGEASARHIEKKWKVISPEARVWVFKIEDKNGARIL